MGNTESGPIVDDAEFPKLSAKATAAEYAKASKVATAVAKSKISEFYPRGIEVPHSSISVQQENRDSANQHDIIEATLPRREEEDTRDQFAESPNTRMNRDEVDNFPTQSPPAAQQLIPAPRPYKLPNGETVHIIPMISMKKTATPKREPEQEVNMRDSSIELSQQDIKANHLLQNIIHLDTEVTEATAAVYHYLETSKVDNEFTARGRAVEVVRHIKEELKKGNSKPAYHFLETARTVLPVLREEKLIDVEAGLQLEADIFSEDSEDSAVFVASTVPAQQSPNQKNTQNDDARSISDETAAVFHYLNTAVSNGIDGDKHVAKDPVGSKSVGGNIDSESNIFRILEETRDNDAVAREVCYIAQQNELPPGSVGQFSDLDSIHNFNAPNVEDMDLEFVESFDLAYSEFLYYHPKFVAKNPELMQNLRIYKLQKFLEYNEILERKNLEQLDAMNREKRMIEESMQLQLKGAIRKKAARQTFLQSEVNDIHLKTKQIQTKLRWKVLKYSEDRAKRQVKLREQFKTIPHAKTREDILPLIPDGLYSKKLETAIKASFIAEGSSLPDVLSSRQEDQLNEIKVENSILNSEIGMLNKRLAHLRSEANKLEWVQSTLVELDPLTMHKLKEKLKKKEGVSL
uniref:Uncharacterized protein n=1 Tax=Pseudo-nitzschia australis TaxID=44445 RepID=A0A7S4EEN6_9STRA|mmetsp:Transcript_20300/g.44183  ORF Transcript_20300/g.44183 Transcript_20300/m.44183 type:complete len:633 (+) Transcript_20300:90-1988(+)